MTPTRLTADFFGNSDEVEWFFKIFRRVLPMLIESMGDHRCVARFPAFADGRIWFYGYGCGAPYYLPQFMREQVKLV